MSLYTLPDIYKMRQTLAHTVASAQRDHNATGRVLSVNPWISLGAGYRPIANRTGKGVHLPQMVYDMKWDFSRVTSWAFGTQSINPFSYGIYKGHKQSPPQLDFQGYLCEVVCDDCRR